MKVSQRNLLALIDEEGNVVLVNDTLVDENGQVKVTDAETGRTLFEGVGKFPANGVARIGKADLIGQGLAWIAYRVRDEILYNHYLYGKPPFKFADVRRWLKKDDG